MIDAALDAAGWNATLVLFGVLGRVTWPKDDIESR